MTRVITFPRQRILRVQEAEVRRRVDAWRRRSVRRRLLVNALLKALMLASIPLLTWAVLSLGDSL